MPGSLNAWYSLSDLAALGDRQGELSGELALERMARLRDLLHDAGGSVRAQFGVRRRAGGGLMVELRYEATLSLICQRCLEPMQQRLAARTELALVESESQAAGLPRDCEPLLLDAGRLRPADVFEDELLVAMPLVPRHPQPEECGSLARALSAPAAEPTPARAAGERS